MRNEQQIQDCDEQLMDMESVSSEAGESKTKIAGLDDLSDAEPAALLQELTDEPTTVSPAQAAVVQKAVEGRGPLTFKGHSKAVNSVAFSPDGKRIVSGGFATAKVWDAETGREEGQWGTSPVYSLSFGSDGTKHSGWIYSVGFSLDGKRIVGGSTDSTVWVWDSETGQDTLRLKGHSSHVWSVSFSPDGKWIVSGSDDNTLKVWDAQTGQETLTLKGHTHEVRSVSFSPDGKRIVSGSDDKTVRVWDISSPGTSK